MAARIIRLRTKADRLRQDDAEQLRQTVLEFAANHQMPERAVDEIIAAIDRETATRGWKFVMVDPEINSSVVKWLIQHSSRPMVAVRLWADLFPYIPNDTCEIVRTRAELAATLSVPANEVSRIMTELETIGAISRQRGPAGGVRYYMNPLVGTHLSGAARGKAQTRAKARPLNFAPPPKKAEKARPHLSAVK